MSDTVLVDELLAGHSLMRVKDKQKVESLLKTLNSGGLEKLQVVADFDYTLTKTRNEKGSLDCSWGVLENSPLMPESYTKECNALKARYLPIELDPHMPVEEKVPHMLMWYHEANKQLQNSGLRKEMFAGMVQESNLEFRDGTNEMFVSLANANVPVLLLSAGLGDLIEEILQIKNIFHSNVKVVSNYLEYDTEGHVVGLSGEIIHVYNKNESAIQDSDYFKKLQARNNVILLGDSIGDLNMCNGLENPGAVLKIGFLNFKIVERLETYLDLFDIVLIDDQTMDVPMSIINKLS